MKEKKDMHQYDVYLNYMDFSREYITSVIASSEEDAVHEVAFSNELSEEKLSAEIRYIEMKNPDPQCPEELDHIVARGLFDVAIGRSGIVMSLPKGDRVFISADKEGNVDVRHLPLKENVK